MFGLVAYREKLESEPRRQLPDARRRPAKASGRRNLAKGRTIDIRCPVE